MLPPHFSQYILLIFLIQYDFSIPHEFELENAEKIRGYEFRLLKRNCSNSNLIIKSISYIMI